MKLTCVLMLTLQVVIFLLAKLGVLLYSIVMIGNMDVSLKEIDDLFVDNPVDQEFNIINLLPNKESIIQFISLICAYIMLATLWMQASARICQTKTKVTGVCEKYCVFDQYSS